MSQAFSPHAPRSSGISQTYAAWIVSGVCLLAIAFAWQDVTHTQLQNEQKLFERQTTEMVFHIEQALSSCEQALRNTAALAGNSISSDTNWRGYLAALASAAPASGIQEIRLASAADAHGVTAPPAQRAIALHQVLKFARIAAIHRSFDATGSSPELVTGWPLAGAAPSSGLTVNNGMRDAHHAPPPDAVAFMYLPIPSPASNRHGRQQQKLADYVFARISVRHLIENALGEADRRIRVRVFEGHEPRTDFLLYDSSNDDSSAQPKLDGSRLSKSTSIGLNGNYWTVRFDAPQPDPLSFEANRAGAYILCAGLIMIIALFGAMRAFVRAGKHIRPEHEHSHRELKNLIAALEALRDQEQKRLAQELHDDLGQLLAAMKMDLAGLTRLMPPDDPAASSHLNSINDHVNAMMTSVRRIISGLPPKALADLGLFDALRLMAQNFEKQHCINCPLNLPLHEPCMSQSAASAIYRMVQESLNNVAKHACASDVEINMEILDNRILLSIADNGNGFSAQALQKAGSFGLLGMRERAASLNGGMKVESAIGAGTTIYISLPIEVQENCGSNAAASLVEGI